LEHQLHPYFWQLLRESGFHVGAIDQLNKDNQEDALESTGAVAIDRRFKRAYVSLS